MKKFLLYLSLTLLVLASLFGYLLYQEGAFDSKPIAQEKTLKPFMKCETGKCASGKCSGS
ncbi:hypothetical protein MNB_SV-13-1136 [hydrothermal vent metagenome]|uniref:Uncharacterized protein n=1 Tax=hydrothermal vent metagenome TaxID=652676 RepID=A0A1W1CLN5_9ZZZZ